MPNNATTIFYVTLFILIGLEVIVIYLIASYYKLLKSYDKVISKQRQMEEDVSQKSREMLTAAEEQARTIVATANSKAQQIVTQSEGFNAQTQMVIQNALQTFLTEQTDVYRRTFDAVRKDVLAYVQELNQAYRQRADQEIYEINTTFTKEMNQTTKAAQLALAEAYRKIEREVESYKQQRLKNIDQKVEELTTKIIREVMHATVDLPNHERLIMEALDAAHKDHVI
jgi:hypothetical protein